MPPTTSTRIIDPITAGSKCGSPAGAMKLCCPWELGKWEGRVAIELHPPPVLISPVAIPSSASRPHCPRRNGCSSCCLVCSNVTPMTSTADFAKLALPTGRPVSACTLLAGRVQVNAIPKEEDNRGQGQESLRSEPRFLKKGAG